MTDNLLTCLHRRSAAHLTTHRYCSCPATSACLHLTLFPARHHASPPTHHTYLPDLVPTRSAFDTVRVLRPLPCLRGCLQPTVHAATPRAHTTCRTGWIRWMDVTGGTLPGGTGRACRATRVHLPHSVMPRILTFTGDTLRCLCHSPRHHHPVARYHRCPLPAPSAFCRPPFRRHYPHSTPTPTLLCVHPLTLLLPVPAFAVHYRFACHTARRPTHTHTRPPCPPQLLPLIPPPSAPTCCVRKRRAAPAAYCLWHVWTRRAAHLGWRLTHTARHSTTHCTTILACYALRSAPPWPHFLPTDTPLTAPCPPAYHSPACRHLRTTCRATPHNAPTHCTRHLSPTTSHPSLPFIPLPSPPGVQPPFVVVVAGSTAPPAYRWIFLFGSSVDDRLGDGIERCRRYLTIPNVPLYSNYTACHIGSVGRRHTLPTHTYTPIASGIVPR